MPTHIRKWLLRILLNAVGLLLSLGLLYVVAVVVVLMLSTRATAKHPMDNLFQGETLLVLIGAILAIGLVFRCTGRIYTLLTTPPAPEK